MGEGDFGGSEMLAGLQAQRAQDEPPAETAVTAATVQWERARFAEELRIERENWLRVRKKSPVYRSGALLT